MRKDRLDEILDHVEREPHTWSQRAYHSDCGTAHCVAGHAQLRMRAGQGGGRLSPTGMFLEGDGGHAGAYADATAWLDVTPAQANYLFHPSRTLPEMRRFSASGGGIPDDWRGTPPAARQAPGPFAAVWRWLKLKIKFKRTRT